MSLLSTPYAVRAGLHAGFTGQGTGAISIGWQAGATGQKTFGVALGPSAGFSNQGTGAVAVGFRAGYTGQGAYSLAVGPYAGSNNLPQNAIALNASQVELNPGFSGLYIYGLNSSTAVNAPLIYDTATSGVMYRSIGSTATRLNVYPMEIATPFMTAQTTAGTGGNYTATASSEFDGNYTAWRAFTNATGPFNEWATLGVLTNYWIQMQMPVARNIAYIAMFGRLNGASNETPSSFYLRVSNDGTNFIDVRPSPSTAYAYTGQFSSNLALPCGFVVPPEFRNYTYYRFQFPTSYGGPNPGLAKLKMFRPSSFSTTSTNAMFGSTINIFRANTMGWGFNFTSRGGYVVVKAHLSYATASDALTKLWMYIDGTRANFTAANEVVNWAITYSTWWQMAPIFYWAGQLAAGDHVITFDGQSNVLYQPVQSGTFEVYEVL